MTKSLLLNFILQAQSTSSTGAVVGGVVGSLVAVAAIGGGVAVAYTTMSSLSGAANATSALNFKVNQVFPTSENMVSFHPQILCNVYINVCFL